MKLVDILSGHTLDESIDDLRVQEGSGGCWPLQLRGRGGGGEKIQGRKLGVLGLREKETKRERFWEERKWGYRRQRCLKEHFAFPRLLFSVSAPLCVCVCVCIGWAAHFISLHDVPGSNAAKWKGPAWSRGCYRRDAEGTCPRGGGTGELDWPLCLPSGPPAAGGGNRKIESAILKVLFLSIVCFSSNGCLLNAFGE